jgi:hypothetical protein
LEGSGRRLIIRYYPGIHPEEKEKPLKTSVKIAGLQAKIQTPDLPNRKQMR